MRRCHWTESKKQVVQSHSQLQLQKIFQQYYFIQTFLVYKECNRQSWHNKMGYYQKKRKKSNLQRWWLWTDTTCTYRKLDVHPATFKGIMSKNGHCVVKLPQFSGKINRYELGLFLNQSKMFPFDHKCSCLFGWSTWFDPPGNYKKDNFFYSNQTTQNHRMNQTQYSTPHISHLISHHHSQLSLQLTH